MMNKAQNKNKEMSKEEIEIEKEKAKRIKMSELYVLLENKGLVTKEGKLADSRVSYCRGKDLVKIFNENKNEIADKILGITGDDIDTKKGIPIDTFYKVFLVRGMLVKADRFEEDNNKKFPKRLKPLAQMDILNFDEKALYVVNIIREVQKSSYVYLFTIIFLILFVCLFPIWPLWLKIYIWWGLLVLLLSLVAFIFLRLIIYGICYVVGYDVWILPNLLADNMPFLSSFSPLIGYWPRQDTWSEIFLRFGVLFFFMAFSIHTYLYPETFYWGLDLINYLKNEALEWGYNKLSNYHNNSNSVSIMDRHNRIMNGMTHDDI